MTISVNQLEEAQIALNAPLYADVGGKLDVSRARVFVPFRAGVHIVRPGPTPPTEHYPLPGLRIHRSGGGMRARVPGETPPYRFDLPTVPHMATTRVTIDYWSPCLLSATLTCLRRLVRGAV